MVPELSQSKMFVFGPFRLNVVERRLTHKGSQIPLPDRAFDTLCVLVSRSGHLVKKSELVDKVWPDTIVEENNLEKNISLLRRFLSEGTDDTSYIETVRGHGYRFVCSVTIEENKIAGNKSFKTTGLVKDLIGRESEIFELSRIFSQPDVRVLTLTGLGGVGKTTLASAFASLKAAEFPDGVHFVELASVTDPDMVLTTIASDIGLAIGSEKTVSDLLAEHFAIRESLLILDNFEQVVTAGPALSSLIATTSNLKILVTSRVRLRLRSEVEFLVPPLSAPESNQNLFDRDAERQPANRDDDYEDILRFGSVRLFVKRAGNIKQGFSLNAENAKFIGSICARLEGIPLAIELAAARINLLQPREMLAKLQNQLKFLTGGALDSPQRQQTMAATVKWSYDHLSESEKRLFARLAVFAGGFTLEAAQAVTSEPDVEILDGVGSLVDSSLLTVREAGKERTRFFMLEVVREFALEYLSQSGESSSLAQNHASYFLSLASAAEPHFQFARSAEWLEILEEDHDNLRRAVEWGLDNDVDVGRRLGAALWRFWWLHGHVREARVNLAKLLEKKDGKDDAAKLKVFAGAAFLNRLSGDFEAARTFVQNCFDLASKLDDKATGSFAMYQSAMLFLDSGDVDLAREQLGEGLQLARISGDKQVYALLLNGMGEHSRTNGDFAAAVEYYSLALEINREIGDSTRQVTNLINLGATSVSQNKLVSAGEFYRQGLEISSAMDDTNGTLYCLEGIAGTVWATKDPERAARLLGAVDAARNLHGLLIEPADRPPYEKCLERIKASMKPERFEECFQMGRGLTIEESISLALERSDHI